MGLVNKPHTHVANTLIEAAKVNANDDAIYNEFNGNIENANIKAAAAIAQSKIANLVSDLAGKQATISLTANTAVRTNSSGALTVCTEADMAYGVRTVSTSEPSGGANGDVWFKY